MIGSTRQLRHLGRGLALLAAATTVFTVSASVVGIRDLAARDPVFLGNTISRAVELLTWRLPLHWVESVPLSARLAQWGGPISLALIAIYLVLRALNRPLKRFLASRQRDHVVICGDGHGVETLVDDLVRAGSGVLVLHRTTTATTAPAAAIDLPGDPTATASLETAAVAQARALVVLGNDDLHNLAVVTSVTEHCRTRRPQQLDPLRCVAEVSGDVFKQGVARMRPAEMDVRVDRTFFSKPRVVARRLLNDHPPRSKTDQERSTNHVLIAFRSRIAEEILLQTLRLLGSEHGALRLTLLDAAADEWVRELRDRIPPIDKICDLRPRVLEKIELRGQITELLDAATSEPISAIYLCADDLDASLELFGVLSVTSRDAALQLPPIFIYSAGDPTMLQLIGGDLQDSGLIPFSDQGAYTSRSLIGEELDTLAKTVHDAYLQQEQPATAASDRPTYSAWNQLADHYRESCRHQADHIEIKLRSIGCRSMPASTPSEFTFTETEIETLARLEHSRWVVERYLDGWAYGTERDEARRRSPDLIPYDELPDHRRELDRAAVRNIPRLLARIGKAIERQNGQPLE